jgi:hypothetical protein
VPQDLLAALTVILADAQEIPTWVGVVGAVVSAVLVRYVDGAFFAKSKGRELHADVAEQIRDELRVDLDELREDVDDLNLRLDNWKERYFKLRHAYNGVKNACKLMRIELMYARGDLKDGDLARMRMDQASGRIEGVTAAIAAEIEAASPDDAFLVEVEREIAVEENERREKQKRRLAANKRRQREDDNDHAGPDRQSPPLP